MADNAAVRQRLRSRAEKALASDDGRWASEKAMAADVLALLDNEDRTYPCAECSTPDVCWQDDECKAGL